MAQDYYAVLIAPTSEATARAFANNNQPMTPLRTSQAINESYYQRFVAAVGLLETKQEVY